MISVYATIYTLTAWIMLIQEVSFVTELLDYKYHIPYHNTTNNQLFESLHD